MILIKHSELSLVDVIAQRKNDLAYVKGNQLVLKNSTNIDLPIECFVVGESSADYNVYIHGEGFAHTYRLNEDLTLELLNPKKSRSVIVLNTNQYLLNYSEDAENTITYFKDGQQVWQKPQQKRYLGNNDSTIVTSPNFKMTSLEIRDLATFTVQKVIETDQDFKVSHHTNIIGDTLIFFQTRRVPEFAHEEVIATAINLIDNSIIWTNKYHGSSWLLVNEYDKQLYSLSGVWVNKAPTFYVETLNPKTGETSRSLLEQDTDIVTSPWLAKIVNNTLFYADSGTKGTCVSAIDLSTKKLVARCDLNLAEGVKIAEPYIAGNDLWVLDTNKTLHQLTIDN